MIETRKALSLAKAKRILQEKITSRSKLRMGRLTVQFVSNKLMKLFSRLKNSNRKLPQPN